MDFSKFGITPGQVDQFSKFMSDIQEKAQKAAAGVQEQMDTTTASGEEKSTVDLLLHENKAVHVGINCKVCALEICGRRYQCMECEEYDLCSDCEGKGHHAGHVMMRISFPEQTLPNTEGETGKMGRRESREYSKWMKRAAIHQERSEKAYARAAATASGRAPKAEGEPGVDFAAVATAGIQRFLGNWGVPTDPKELYGQFMKGTGPFAGLQTNASDKKETESKDKENSDKEGTSKTDADASPADLNELFTKTLNQLIRMGFSNDRGYLTKLIADHKGDLGAVLGALFPN